MFRERFSSWAGMLGQQGQSQRKSSGRNAPNLPEDKSMPASVATESPGRIAVLSIDGGGIRGVIPAMLLDAIEAGTGRPVSQLFDLIAGTSTGGIIALATGTAVRNGQPYSAENVAELYAENGQTIFEQHWYTGIRSIFGPKYSPKPLEEVLGEYFGRTKFSAALTPLLISSYDLTEQKPYFFKSHRIATDPSWDWPLATIARATSAAPTFFPPLRVFDGGKERALVDGGIFANNPAMAAYAEARRLYPTATDFLVVSVGTGDREDQISYAQAKGWGLFGWAEQIVPVMMDSVSEAVDYELQWIFSGTSSCEFYRFQPRITIASPNMDDARPDNIRLLRLEAEKYLSDAQQQFRFLCTALESGRGGRLRGTGIADGAQIT
jgi:patatin-like phospholipase/acyl hydrolase